MKNYNGNIKARQILMNYLILKSGQLNRLIVKMKLMVALIIPLLVE